MEIVLLLLKILGNQTYLAITLAPLKLSQLILGISGKLSLVT